MQNWTCFSCSKFKHNLPYECFHYFPTENPTTEMKSYKIWQSNFWYVEKSKSYSMSYEQTADVRPGHNSLIWCNGISQMLFGFVNGYLLHTFSRNKLTNWTQGLKRSTNFSSNWISDINKGLSSLQTSTWINDVKICRKIICLPGRSKVNVLDWMK